jgi:hypothetical protein
LQQIFQEIREHERSVEHEEEEEDHDAPEGNKDSDEELTEAELKQMQAGILSAIV